MIELIVVAVVIGLLAVVGALHDSPWDHHDVDRLGDEERYTRRTHL